MITVDEKYRCRPITKQMALIDFEQGGKVLAIVGELDNITAVQIFYPHHHKMNELLKREFNDAKWFADWE